MRGRFQDHSRKSQVPGGQWQWAGKILIPGSKHPPYAFSGYLVIVPKENTSYLDMAAGQAVKVIIPAGLPAGKIGNSSLLGASGQSNQNST
jgi:uncharacterized membrane protein